MRCVTRTCSRCVRVLSRPRGPSTGRSPAFLTGVLSRVTLSRRAAGSRVRLFHVQPANLRDWRLTGAERRAKGSPVPFNSRTAHTVTARGSAAR